MDIVMHDMRGRALRCLSAAIAVATLGILAGCGGQLTGTAKPQSMSINGPATVVVGSTALYYAQPLQTNLMWYVNGVPGGSSSTGTIVNGTYTAPSAIGSANSVVISCSGVNGGDARISVQLQNPEPVIGNASIGSGGLLDVPIKLGGTGFTPDSVAYLNGTSLPVVSESSTALTMSVPITFIQHFPISVTVSNPSPGGGDSNTVQINGKPPAVTIKAAARFLDQATFGPTLADIQNVQSVGFAGYLAEQFSEPASLIPNEPNYLGLTGDCRPFVQCWSQGWWGRFALWGPDQLRQRVAFALSEQWVVSLESVPAYYMPQFINVLSSDAFGNWRTLMQDVTLSPAMGTYLNMVNSKAPEPGTQANQNYAREVMQLFNLGPDRLNEDGTLELDANGNPIPVYSPEQIDAFSRAFTGWTYQLETESLVCTPPSKLISDTDYSPAYYGVTGFTCPLVPINSFHDESQKILLDGVTLPSGQTALQDLNGALDDIFNDPNLPPFVAKELIQHLVMSNPPPDYVRRVADVFKDDGNGVRGDMKAVITAILMDPDARADDAYGVETEDGGKLREPLLWMISLARALGAQDSDPGKERQIILFLEQGGNFGEELMTPSDVTSFFSPGYKVQGSTLLGPEFQLESTASIPLERQIVDEIEGNFFDKSMTFDLSPGGLLDQLAAQSHDDLIAYLNIVMMHGSMSSQMRSDILTAINGDSPQTSVDTAVYLIATSPQYRVMD